MDIEKVELPANHPFAMKKQVVNKLGSLIGLSAILFCLPSFYNVGQKPYVVRSS